MIKVKIPALDTSIEVDRLIDSVTGAKQSPTIVFIAGIHGNETSGLYAVKKVIRQIKESQIWVKGNIYAITGNMNALKEGVRYTEMDLNRIWTHEQIEKINGGQGDFVDEEYELIAMYSLVKQLMQIEKGPFLFLDLHSTSAFTTPFITISDSINNRKFSNKFPVPIVLGIEEYLDGPLLSFINEFGHIALGFESGQHNDIQAIKSSEAFIWLALVFSGCVRKKAVPNFDKYMQQLSAPKHLANEFFEIDFGYPINSSGTFKMQPHYINFDPIDKNQELALDESSNVTSPIKGRIFMPLYQEQGDDGFFVVTHISKFWLVLSKSLRRIHFYKVLRLLPGIRKYKSHKHILEVNPKTAKFLATEIFHLFGYRKKIDREDHWLFIKRDRKVTPLN
jgi:predicted deacylase